MKLSTLSYFEMQKLTGGEYVVENPDNEDETYSAEYRTGRNPQTGKPITIK